jgi:hypothetical protein
MKKKLKKAIKRFFQPTDKEENFEYDSIYELVERLQYRVEDLENEHMLLLKELAKLQSQSGST